MQQISLRFIAYRLVRALLRRLVDPDLRAQAELIFAIAESKVPQAVQQGSPELVNQVLKSAAGMVLAPNRVKPWHVEQLRDLYDPKVAAQHLAAALVEGLGQ